jgi:zinc/manganese transport system permease protein
MVFDTFIAPFADHAFMRNALSGCVLLSLSAPPIGVFLTLRRMSLIGDAMSHAVFPGVALGFLMFGSSLLAMAAGGLIVGLAVALLSGLVSRLTVAREDSSLAAFYLVAIAAGVILVSIRGSSVDLVHVLFGSVLALDAASLVLVACAAAVSIVGLVVIRRPLVLETIDPTFLRTVSRWGAPAHLAFLALVVLNLVAGFTALGTLLAIGLMLLPAAAARFWSAGLPKMIAAAALVAIASSYSGLLLSYHVGMPAGPAIILSAGFCYLVSMLSAGVLRQGALAH